MEGDDTFYVLSTNPNVETCSSAGSAATGSRSPARAGGPGQRPARPHRAGPQLGREPRGLAALDRHPGRRHRRRDPRQRRTRISVVPVTGSLVVSEAGTHVSQLQRPADRRAEHPGRGHPRRARRRPDLASRSRSVELSLDGVHWSTSVTLVFAAGSTDGPASTSAPPSTTPPRASARRPAPDHGRRPRSRGTVARGHDESLTTRPARSPASHRRWSAAGRSITGGHGARPRPGPSRRSTDDTLTLGRAWTMAPDRGEQLAGPRRRRLRRAAASATPLVRVLDDDQADVVVTQPDGGVQVTEPVATATGGTVSDLHGELRRPVADRHRDRHARRRRPAAARRQRGQPGRHARPDLHRRRRAHAKTIDRHRAVSDGTVEGQHFRLSHAPCRRRPATTCTVTVTGGTGPRRRVRSPAPPFADRTRCAATWCASPAAPAPARSRYIWSATPATIITVEGDWDVRPGHAPAATSSPATPRRRRRRRSAAPSSPSTRTARRSRSSRRRAADRAAASPGADPRIVGDATGPAYYR